MLKLRWCYFCVFATVSMTLGYYNYKLGLLSHRFFIKKIYIHLKINQQKNSNNNLFTIDLATYRIEDKIYNNMVYIMTITK